MTFKNFIFVFIAVVILPACKNPSFPTVPIVDVDRFTGTWYEIASLPTTYNKDCSCSKIVMSLEKQDCIHMVSSCMRENSEIKSELKAVIQEGSGNAKMRVQMFWPFRTNYYVIALGPDYEYTMVCNPDKTSLQILSRQKFLDSPVYDELIAKAESLGFESALIVKISQTCD